MLRAVNDRLITKYLESVNCILTTTLGTVMSNDDAQHPADDTTKAEPIGSARPGIQSFQGIFKAASIRLAKMRTSRLLAALAIGVPFSLSRVLVI